MATIPSRIDAICSSLSVTRQRRRRRLDSTRKQIKGRYQNGSHFWHSCVRYSYLWAILLSIILGSTGVVESSRAYPLGCSQEAASYYDYDNCPFPPPGVRVKSSLEYQLVERLGTGKFGDVFSAVETVIARDDINTNNNSDNESDGDNNEPSDVLSQERNWRDIDPDSLVVVKCLKPVTDRKIRRELLILYHSSKLPNLARLLVGIFVIICGTMD